MKRLAILLVLLVTLPMGSTAQLRPNPAHPLVRGLVGWWRAVPGLTGGTTWYDLMPAARHGTLLNMTGTADGWSATDRPGGTAQVNFDGVDDAVQVGGTTDFQFANATFTVTGWVKASNCATNTCALVGKRQLTTGSWFVRIDTGGTLTARLDGLSGTNLRSTVTSTWADGTWRHFAAVMTSDTTTMANNAVTIYTNGVLDQGALTQTDVYNPGTVPVAFGVQADNLATAPLTGALDDIRIYDHGLSDREVAALYQQSVRGDPDLLPVPALMPMLPDLLAAALPVPGATTWGVPPSQQSPSILNRGHALLQGQTDWWKAMPGFTGMGNLYPFPNLLTFNGLKLNLMGTGMASDRSSGWALGTARPGGYAEIAFDGIQGSMYTENATAPTAFSQPLSVCVWARPDVSNRTLMELITSQPGASPYDGVRFALGDQLGGNFNTPYLQIIDTTTKIIGVRGPSDSTSGAWHHYCGTYDGSGTAAGITVYTDGQALTPTTSFNDAGGATMTNRLWYVGANVAGSNYFQGAMDDIRLWTRALSAAEVRWVYLESRQGDPSLFVAPGVGGLPVAAVAPGQFLPFFR